jgi:preprotein translocase subunit SecF
MLKIVEKARLWFGISIIIIVIGLSTLAVKGLNYGIDFKGGTLVVINMGNVQFNKQDVQDIFRKQASDAVTNVVDNTSIEIRSNNLDTGKVDAAFQEVKAKYNLQDTALESSNEISASIGKELTSKALTALGVATILMLLYVGVRFEFNFGVAAILALLHDILITLSVYAIFSVPVNSPFIAAMLTIIGYSINDTIVIFDRIRENLKVMRKSNIAEVANASVTQTMSRSINTTLTTIVTIAAVYYFVPAVRDFAFPIIIGIISGAYSSIFIASPIWVLLKNRSKKRRVMA